MRWKLRRDGAVGFRADEQNVISQGLKPIIVVDFFGTTEVVP